MPRLPLWTASDAERSLLAAGLELLRSKGSHRIYGKGRLKVTVPFHSGEILHPKIV
jgi:predicted RNA binding protein YcfA (HicA-like mRNA interferase family)